MSDQKLQTKINQLDNLMSVVDANLQEVERQQAATWRLLSQYRRGQLIPFKSLSEVAEGEKLLLAPGVRCYRIKSVAPNHLAFVSEFDQQSTLRSHYHDCEQHVQILRGSLHDFATGKVITEQAFYQPKQEHELYSPGGCLCLVRFTQ